MTEDLRDTLQGLLDTTDKNKKEYGKKAFYELIQSLKFEGYRIDTINAFTTDLIKLLVSADRACHGREHEFCMSTTLLKMSKRDFYSVTNGGSNPLFKYNLYQFISTLDKDSFVRIVRFASALFAYDNIITTEELLVLDELLKIGERGD